MTRAKKLLALLLTVILTVPVLITSVSAKTISSPKADNIFFYATNADGKSVLLKVMTLSELKALAHGQVDGKNYYISTTDNYPTTQYCEAKGFTVNELVNYVKSVTTVHGAGTVDFSGGDTLRLMATDSYGNYSRAWTWDELYGIKRYYFEGLYDSGIGWNTGWEIAGTDNSMYGVSLEEYNASYKDIDPYYANKRAVFSGGVETTVILATESYSGRTTSDALTASTEPGIASYIAANGGTVAGCLKGVISDEYALRLSLPMTEADLMAAHRTAYDNFKWIYNLRLDMANAPSIKSLGTVAQLTPAFTLNGDTLTVSFACATAGASIYYGFDGAAQALYTGPVTVDITGRDLDSDPVTVYATAVKEGYDDAGVMSFQYPGMAPSFRTVYSGMTGSALTLEAADSVSESEWAAWTQALNYIMIKTPSTAGYIKMDDEKYTIDGKEKTISFDQSLFTDAGSYSFVFHNTKYADKSLSVTMKSAAPELSAPESIAFGSPLTVGFADKNYNSGLSVYVTPEDGTRTMIASSYLDRAQEGQVTIRAEYFTLSSTAMPGAGKYILELVNNSYTPASQTVAVTLTGGFTDVAESAWYYTYVTELSNAGIINGMGDGTFAPDGTLNWGQAIKLLLLTAGYDEQAPTGAHWASGYMDAAAAGGLIDRQIDPDTEITRLEFCRVAAGLLDAETTVSASPFTDTTDRSVLALYELGIIDGMGDGTFRPNETLSRAQISKIIWCMMRMERSE